MATEIRDDLYHALLAAISDNAGYLYRGKNGRPGPQVGLGRFTHLKRWGWVNLVHVRTVKRGQVHLEIAGGWITREGRAALRSEITRRGDVMPARLVIHRRAPAAPTPAPAAPVVPSAVMANPDLAVLAASIRAATTPRPPARPATADADPFALIATGGGRAPVDLF
ncbi:hypothetical protein [Micromonospora sp. RP3T]|uniref:hypothetical protein n=1 Tax=Micromonospora sp. RP3T TaxID=2135446 RepID=UPI003D75D8E3